MQNFTLRTRLFLIVIVVVAGFLITGIFSAISSKEVMLDGYKEQLRASVQTTYNQLAYFHGLETSGKLTREEAQQQAKIVIKNARFGGADKASNYFFVYTMEGIGVVPPPAKPEWEGKPLLGTIKDSQGRLTLDDLIGAVKSAPEGYVDSTFPRAQGGPGLPKLSFVMKFDAWNWMIGTGIYTDDVDNAFRSVLLTQAAVALLPLLLVGLLVWMIARSVLGEIGGEPAAAAVVMRRIADGDLTTSIGTAKPGSLLHTLGAMVSALREMVAQISASANALVTNAEQISTSVSNVASTSHQQSDATSSMAAAIEELTVSSSHISDNAGRTERYSQEAVQLSGQGGERIRLATDAMQRIAGTVKNASEQILSLNQRANQISSIAASIKDIAGQTNLLALNAAIEAARAGEQGRGFAVVADEVRKLAERTSTATAEIEEMITGIQSGTESAVAAMSTALPEVEQGVQLSDSAAESLGAIEQGAHKTLNRITEVANSTREQSAASDSIARRVEEIARMVEETSVAMRGTAQSAGSLQNVAVDLKQIVGKFTI